MGARPRVAKSILRRFVGAMMELEGWLREEAAAAVALIMRGVMMTGATVADITISQGEHAQSIRVNARSEKILEASDFLWTCPKGAMRAWPTAANVEVDELPLAMGARDSRRSLLVDGSLEVAPPSRPLRGRLILCCFLRTGWELGEWFNSQYQSKFQASKHNAQGP